MSVESLASPNKTRNDRWLDKAVFPWWPNFTVEQLLIALIIILTLITRFYDLGARTMAHDEINHVVPAYTIENYVYDPSPTFQSTPGASFPFGDRTFPPACSALFGTGYLYPLRLAPLPGAGWGAQCRHPVHDLAFYSLLQPLYSQRDFHCLLGARDALAIPALHGGRAA